MNTLEKAKVMKNCLYIPLPVHEVGNVSYRRLDADSHNFQFGTLQFGKFEEIEKQGFHAAMDILEKFDDEGRLPSVSLDSKDGLANGRQKGRSARRNSI